MRLRGAREAAAQIKAVGASMKGMAATAASSTAAATTGLRRMLPSLATLKTRAESMKAAGSTMTRGLTVPIMAIGVVAGKMSMDFTEAVNQIQTQAGVGGAEVARMRDAIMDYAKSGESSEGPKALAEGMYRIASAGLRGKAAIDAMIKAEQLATVGRVDMETASTALAAAVKTNIRGTKDYSQAVGTLNSIVGAGNMRMGDLTSALGTGILPRAKAAGLSLSDVGAALATMTSQGMPAAASATRFGMSMSQLIAPSDKAKEALAQLGLQPMELAKQLQSGNFVGALGNLKKRLDGLSKVEQGKLISDIFGGGRSSASITLLLGSLDDLRGKLKQIKKGSDGFNKSLDEANTSPTIRLQRAWAQVQAALIELGDAIIPVVVPMLQKMAGFISAIASGFKNLPGPVKTFIVILAGVAAAAGPLLTMIGGMTMGIYGIGTALTFLSANPIVLIIAAIVALGIGLVIAYKKIGWFRDAVDAVFGFLKSAVTTVIGFVKSHWQLLVAIILGPVTLIGYGIIKNWDKIKNATKAAWTWVKNAISNAVKAVLGFLRNNWKTILAIMLGPVTIAARLIMMNWGKIKAGARALVGAIKGAFSSIVGAVRSAGGAIANAASGMFDGIKNAFKGAINFIIRGWNSLEFRIPGFDPPGPGPKFGGMTIGVPDIPLLAAGGMFRGSGWSIVGDRGPELMYAGAGARVVPLSSRAPSSRTDYRGPALEGQDVPPIIVHSHVHLNGREIATAVKEVGDRERARR